MPRSTLSAVVLLTLCLAISLGSEGRDSQNAASDESGTEVIFGRTREMVFVSVDSKISGSGEHQKLIDGQRKLVAIGHLSACAIEGYNGYDKINLNIGRDIQDWVRTHPNIEIPTAMNDILAVAAGTWDKHPKTPASLPGGRHIKDIITTIYCATFERGSGIIVAGDTYVAPNTSAAIYPHLAPMTKIFGASGVVEGPDITSDMSAMLQTAEGDGDRLSKRFARDIKNDFASATDLGILHSASNDPSKWQIEDSKRLAADIFRIVESQVPDHVAPPNNAYIVNACGRTLKRVEEKWPTSCQFKSTAGSRAK